MPRSISRFALIVFAFCSALLLQGCGDSVAGTYELDREAMKASLQSMIDKMDDQTEKYNATNFLQGFDGYPAMTLLLAEDGTFEGTTTGGFGVQNSKGTWKVKGSTITFSMTNPGPSDPKEMTGTLKGGKIELQTPEVPGTPHIKPLFRKKKA